MSSGFAAASKQTDQQAGDVACLRLRWSSQEGTSSNTFRRKNTAAFSRRAAGNERKRKEGMDWLLRRIEGGEIDFSRIRGGNVDFLIFDRFDVFLGSLMNGNCRLEALRSWRVL